MPTLLTDQRQPLPPTLREKLIALGANPDTLDQINRQIELHHESIKPPVIAPDLNNDQEIV